MRLFDYDLLAFLCAVFVGAGLSGISVSGYYDQKLEAVTHHYDEQVQSLEAEYRLRAITKHEFMESCLSERKRYECEVMWR